MKKTNSTKKNPVKNSPEDNTGTQNPGKKTSRPRIEPGIVKVNNTPSNTGPAGKAEALKKENTIGRESLSGNPGKTKKKSKSK